MSEGDRVVVRMYRGILGDCFLITVWRSGTPRVAMIDCGALQNVQPGRKLVANLDKSVLESVGAEALRDIEGTFEALDSIQADILDYLADKGGKLDLLVITHDHYDHLAGFLALNEDSPCLHERITIDRLWLSWIENPADKQAQELAARFTKAKTAVSLAAEVGRSAFSAASGRLAQTQALAQFIGPVSDLGKGDAKARPRTTTQAIKALREKVGSKTRFLEPGDVVRLDDGFDLNVYVLGPPRKTKHLFKDLPTGKGEAREVYLTGLDEAAAVTQAALSELNKLRLSDAKASEANGDTIAEEAAALQPFGPPHRRPYPSTGKKTGEPRARGWDELRTAYEAKSKKHRSIDDDWCDAADALALKLDADTNNSSLVLAFELPGDRILLFPGDAQVGNWESWGEQLYPRETVGKEPQKTIEDLLGRVVFYKVGHHASHNATLRDRGLELMTSSQLCAAIPVVEAVAKIQGPGRKAAGKGWKMPYKDLYERLQDRTQDRIVRGDGDPEKERSAFEGSGVSVRHADPDTGGRWVELTFPL